MKKILEKDEELALGRAWVETGSEAARARLVDSYQPMIRRIARRYLRAGLSMDDLAQEGTLGFMASLDNFDPDKGYSVGTLARFHIAARIQLHVSNFAGIIRLPNSRRIKGLLSQCVSTIRVEENQRGEALAQSEKEAICTAAGFSLAELEQYEMVMRPTKQVSQTALEEGETGVDPVDDKTTPEEDVVYRESMSDASRVLADCLADLPERTQTILRLRHLSEDFVSLDSIAARIGVSRERVRRIEMDALALIRDRFHKSGIASLDDIA